MSKVYQRGRGSRALAALVQRPSSHGRRTVRTSYGRPSCTRMARSTAGQPIPEDKDLMALEQACYDGHTMKKAPRHLSLEAANRGKRAAREAVILRVRGVP